jgi:hypothetical protein
MRGLVVSVPTKISGDKIEIRGGGLDTQELRSNLLFWDKLDFPSNNFIDFDISGGDEEFLQQVGILQRTRINFSGSGRGSDIFRRCHVAAYRRLDQQEPGQWSLAVGENSMSFLDNEIEGGRGALVRLYNAVPVPDKDAPLADILDFKEKRRDELLAFRHHLEEVYQKIVNAGDGPLAWNTQVEKLQLAISDHIKASKEAPFRFRLSDISAGLNVLPATSAAIGAYVYDLPLCSLQHRPD